MPPPPKSAEDDPTVTEAAVKKRRKLIQAQHEEEYRNALMRYDKEVEVNEGPDMKEEMMDQLRDWYIKHREREGTFPDFPPPEIDEEEAAAAAAKALEAAAAGGGKDAKKDAKKEDKGKKGKGGDDAEPPPPVPPHFTNRLKDAFQEWSDKWQHRDESDNFAQKHDIELVKQMAR